MTQDRPRLLVPFGSGIVFGSERGNIEALVALKNEGCDVLCLVRPEDWAADVRAALEAAGLDTVVCPYIYEWRRGYTVNFFAHNIFAFPIANLLFLLAAANYRPTHVYAFNAFWILNFLPALTLLRTPLVYRAGDEPSVHNWFFRWLWRVVANKGKRFVANSEFIKKSLIANGVDPERITVIYNKPPTRFTEAPLALPAELTQREKFNVLYVGQIIETKGVRVLIDAFKSLAADYPNAALWIAGPISETWDGDAWARALRQSVSEDPVLKDRVYFLGYVENTPALYRAAQIHVCPSLANEPLANVVMEAKEAGIPSIVFRSGGLPEMVSHGVDGVVCSEKSAQALADALALYMKDPERAAAEGKAARASLSKFHIDAFSRRWRQVIDGASRKDRATPAYQHG